MGIEHQIHTDVMESKSNKERVFFPVFMIIEEEYTTGIELFLKKCNPSTLVFLNVDLPYLGCCENGFVAEDIFENK